MKFIVSVKQVPSRDSALKIDANGTWLDESDVTYEMNEPDAYALEEALQLKEKLGGEVVVVSLGPAGVTQTIREALAKGADRAIHRGARLPRADRADRQLRQQPARGKREPAPRRLVRRHRHHRRGHPTVID